MTLGLYDTFSNPQGCHINRGALYSKTPDYQMWRDRGARGLARHSGGETERHSWLTGTGNCFRSHFLP